eukprot:1916947-Rhodomonas_salina.2
MTSCNRTSCAWYRHTRCQYRTNRATRVGNTHTTVRSISTGHAVPRSQAYSDAVVHGVRTAHTATRQYRTRGTTRVGA